MMNVREHNGKQHYHLCARIYASTYVHSVIRFTRVAIMRISDFSHAFTTQRHFQSPLFAPYWEEDHHQYILSHVLHIKFDVIIRMHAL